MKKNIFRIFAAIIIMTLVVAPPLAYSSLLSMAVQRITPSALMKIGGSAKIPAVVKSVSTNGSTAFNVLNLTLTGAQLGGLAGAVIGTGLGLGIYAANPSWFIENGIRVLSKVGGVDIVKDTVVQVPPADAAPGYDYSVDSPLTFLNATDYGLGYYGSDCNAAEAALLTKCQSLHSSPSACNVGNLSTSNCISQKFVNIEVVVPGEPSISFRYLAYCKYKETCSWQPIDSTQTQSIGPEGLAATMAPQLGNNNQNAWGLLMDVLNRISAGLNNPSHEINAETGLMDDIQSRLQEGISANALADIEESTEAGTADGAVPADANDVYGGLNAGDVVNAVLDALKGQELSSKQIAEEIQKALANDISLTAADIAQKIWDAAPNAVTNPHDGVGAVETNETIRNATNTIDRAIGEATANIVDAIRNKDEGPNVDIPIDPDVLVPDKLSLTSVFNSFYSGLQSLPMVQTFQGMAITAGGSSSLCVDLPSEFGGNRCMNFSSYGSALNVIGSVLLSMTTLFMMVYLFRG